MLGECRVNLEFLHAYDPLVPASAPEVRRCRVDHVPRITLTMNFTGCYKF